MKTHISIVSPRFFRGPQRPSDHEQRVLERPSRVLRSKFQHPVPRKDLA
jgi:hypothetical protein